MVNECPAHNREVVCRHVAGLAWLAGALLALAACQTHSPRPSPTLAERQVSGLRALGFQPSEDDWLLDLPDPIAFKFGQAKVDASAQRQVLATSKQLKRLSIDEVRIDGHSDNRGPEEVNVKLSRLRADAVADIFLSSGFVDAKVIRKGLGASEPIADNNTIAGRARNRRVEIIVPANALAVP